MYLINISEPILVQISLFLIHRSADVFFNCPAGKKSGRKNFFLSILQTSLGLPVASFLKKSAIHSKTITLTLEHTFFFEKVLSTTMSLNHFSLSNDIKFFDVATLSDKKIFVELLLGIEIM